VAGKTSENKTYSYIFIYMNQKIKLGCLKFAGKQFVVSIFVLLVPR